MQLHRRALLAGLGAVLVAPLAPDWLLILAGAAAGACVHYRIEHNERKRGLGP